ncbi:RagB/SusD family nutrient uptake outer membrane protein [Bacteroides caecimuris]|uniref:RagB/SusD family nutrient uptake outer membrane protein n=1 Tax=Bacteroides caecimuris TaxID=1796613 RepID=A0A1C7H5Q2_9BACE|nr:RagB/SusD family nutrient uptake outer membrane protein [Bacteroides caecimuris]ANU59120.1 RagB/SusD family nutrient uptake outer membrane protein [Bacteroides caecimuris]NDO61366.1 RagB/SusD family nutrient uptake outer membrane protein [Bacteroides caecimuris]OXE68272.1 RagB/SusD family nutrient uptake outer membrane protein [Bacteroides caecimuris]QQR15959.1 RagB/SusD family nutrient uptake outer membrane protein [Bacteroides caecimuris]UQA28903.1 RagB/SusD family nutrient uptake outer m
MKKIITILSFAVGLTSLVGCSDYLDSDYLFDERMSIEDVFSNRDYTNRWLARGYFYLSNGYLQDVCSKRDYPFNFADDMYYGDGGYDKWKSGQYDESGVNNSSSGIWKNAYLGIRQVAIFLNNIDKNKEFTEEEITDFKGQAHFLRAYYYWLMLRAFGPVPIIPDEGVDYTKEYDELAYPRNSYDECVDYITSELLKAAGQLPLQRSVQEVLRPTRGAALALRAKILLYAASPLFNGKAPEVVSSALVNKDGKRLLPETYDESKWAKAAAAAKDVMDLNIYGIHVAYFNSNAGDIAYPATIAPPHDDEFSDQSWPNGWKNIDPFQSYREMFDGSIIVSQNEELIFTRGDNQSRESVDIMVVHQLPRNGAGGYGSQGMTQKQCDAYYMNDGTNCPGMNDVYKEFDGYKGRYDSRPRAEGYVKEKELVDYPELGPLGVGVSKQYVRREPRFYASVGYNGSTWHLLNALNDNTHDEQKNIQVFYYRGGSNGYANSSYWLRTGIGIKKYVHPNDISYTQKNSYDVTRIEHKADPAIRYAEILLIYAEALNELTGSYEIPSWDGNKMHSVKRDIAEMKKGIRPVRIRAGLPDYDKVKGHETAYDNPDEFRTMLKRERQIEFFAEGHRYWDLRRWLDAPVEETVPVYGCNMLASKDMADQFHTPVMCTSLPTIFAEKMWLCPIAHTELKHNVNLVQNPGWTNPE